MLSVVQGDQQLPSRGFARISPGSLLASACQACSSPASNKSCPRAPPPRPSRPLVVALVWALAPATYVLHLHHPSPPPPSPPPPTPLVFLRTEEPSPHSRQGSRRAGEEMGRRAGEEMGRRGVEERRGGEEWRTRAKLKGERERDMPIEVDGEQ
eukprot:768273-Hanusia_phi.AAC.4